MLTTSDEFLAKINNELKQLFLTTDLSELDQLSLKIQIYSIFEREHRLAEISSELLELISEEEVLSPLTSIIENYHAAEC